MEKIKKSLRREDGFTLVELLAVIVILGIILAIAIPAIGNVISKSQDKADAADRDLAIDAARLYITNEQPAESEWTSNVLTIAASDLYTKGYLEDRGTAAEASAKKLTGSVEVTRTAITEADGGGGYTYAYKYVEATTG